LEFLSVLLAQAHYACHVNFIERREESGGALRCHQSLGDCSPQPAHRDNLLFAASRLGELFRGSGRSLKSGRGVRSVTLVSAGHPL